MDDLVGLDFFGQLRWHLENGTRPGLGPGVKGTPWGPQEFADACFRGTTRVEVARRNERHWRNDRKRPSAQHYPLIENTLFGIELDNDPYKVWRAAFKAAYRAIPIRGRLDETNQPNNLPFHSLRNLFRGREAALREIQDAFLGNSMVRSAVVSKALHGLGGIGKTRLAIEYAWRNAEAYSALLFVSAENPENLQWSLAALAEPSVLDLPRSNELDDQAKLTAVIRWLASNPVWLLIVDNVDSENAMTSLLRLLSPLRGGHILINGRWSIYPASIPKHEIKELALDEAISFLIDRTRRSPDDEAQARTLATELDGLALALEQAAAYIDTQRISFDAYLTRWQENRSKLLDWYDKNLISYNHDVGLGATFATSIELLTREGRHLLERLVYLDPSVPIPEVFLYLRNDVDGSDLRSELRAPLEDLFAYSLATPSQRDDNGGVGFLVHRLLIDFVERRLGEQDRIDTLLNTVEVLCAVFKPRPISPGVEFIRHSMLAHALAVLREADTKNVMEQAIRLVHDVGRHCHLTSNLQQAEKLLRSSLALHQKKYGHDNAEIEECYFCLAELYVDIGRLRDADELSRIALELCESRNDPESNKETRIARLVLYLALRARVLCERNEFKEAEPLYQRALDICERKLGPNHPALAISLNGYATLMVQKKDFDKAAELFSKFIAAQHGDDKSLAEGVTNLAAVFHAQGRLVESEYFIRLACTYATHAFGPEHENTATAIINLASILGETGRHDEALAWFKRGINIFWSRVGPEHPDALSALESFASFLSASERLNEAELVYGELLRSFLKISEREGREHPRQFAAYSGYFDSLKKMGRTKTEIEAILAPLFSSPSRS